MPKFLQGIGLFSALSLMFVGACAQNQPFNQIKAGEDDGGTPPVTPGGETPDPDEDTDTPPPEGGTPGGSPETDQDITKESNYCPDNFSHDLVIGIDSPDNAGDVTPAAITGGPYAMAVNFASSTLTVQSTDIPTYNWYLEEKGVTFVISGLSGKEYLGTKTSDKLRIQNIEYNVKLYAGQNTTGSPLVDVNVSLDLTTGTATSGSVSKTGSWSGTSASLVGITDLPEDIANLAGSEYAGALLIVSLDGDFAADPAGVDGTGCAPGSGSGDDITGGTASGLELAIADTGYAASLASSASLSVGTVMPAGLVARRLRLTNTGTGTIPLYEAALLSGLSNFSIDASEITGSLGAGEFRDLMVYFYPSLVDPASGTPVTDGDVLYLKTGSSAADEKEMTVLLSAAASIDGVPFAASGYDYPEGAFKGYGITSAAVPANGYKLLVIENTSAAPLKLSKLQIDDMTKGFAVSEAMVGAVSNTTSYFDSFASTCGNATDYQDITKLCYLDVTDGITSPVTIPAATTGSSVVVRVLLSNGGTGSAANLLLEFTNSDGSETYPQAIALSAE